MYKKNTKKIPKKKTLKEFLLDNSVSFVIMLSAFVLPILLVFYLLQKIDNMAMATCMHPNIIKAIKISKLLNVALFFLGLGYMLYDYKRKMRNSGGLVIFTIPFLYGYSSMIHLVAFFVIFVVNLFWTGCNQDNTIIRWLSR